jgi:YebC/PmpR family DNA-binding regulatory protein
VRASRKVTDPDRPSFAWHNALFSGAPKVQAPFAGGSILLCEAVALRPGAMGAQWKQKGREHSADAKGKLFTKLSRELMVASRTGGPDPTTNSRLRLAIEQARRASMTRETLERAIKKGAGLLDGQAQFETIVYEGFAPHQVPVIVECLTDNKNRTAPNMRLLFRKGQLGSSGSVSWDFNRCGAIEASPPAAGADPEEAAINAGAQELEPADDGQTRFLTDASDLDTVSKALAASGWQVTSASLVWIAKNPVTLEGAARAEVEAFLAAIDDDEDVQKLYVGLA